MRIIAGQRRGHKIDSPRASGKTRPTSDLVRESLFNILGELVVDRMVVDLFAGTGALGLEALSRGARSAIFVERDRECVSLIIRNVATLRYEDRAQVRLADAYRWARAYEPVGDDPVVVLLDPPYQDYERRTKSLNQGIAELVRKLPAGSVIALEGGRVLDDQILEDFETWDVRRYSSTQIAIKVIGARPADAPVGPSEEAVETQTDEADGQPESELDE